MYAVLSKKDETSWDVIHMMSEHTDTKISSLMENALSKNTNIVGMETTSFRDNARLGSHWDGVSFSGGVERPEGSVVLDIWDDNKRFSFLSDNTIVSNFVIANESIFSDFLSERFQGEVILVKVPEDQAVAAGETHGWDGSRFTEV
jgi:hypothetical protein